jgi:hypothetical protein
MQRLERLTAQLIFDPVASKYAASLPANLDPMVAATKYRQQAHFGCRYSRAMCLALEHHIRTLATIAFTDPAVLKALSIVEEAQAERNRADKNQKAAQRRLAKKQAKKELNQ